MRVRCTQSAAFSASKPGEHQWMYQGAMIRAMRIPVRRTRYMVVRMTERERLTLGLAA